MSRKVQFGDGAIGGARGTLDLVGVRSVFVAKGATSFRASGAEARLRDALDGRRVVHWTVPGPNPTIESILAGMEAFRADPCDAVLAVGGGSVLDAAKLIAGLAAQGGDPLEIVTGARPIERQGPPLIAVPTTAGSGSEATHFAVVYVERTKYSVAHESLRPDLAIVDPELTHSLPPHATAVCGLDALSQAIESLWSVHSTEASTETATESARLALDNLRSAVHDPTPAIRTAMSRAAHLAGRSIDVTRTTAPHALSYAMTSYFGVPHGHAVALTLGPLLVHNAGVTDENVADPRGVDHVRRTVASICRLLGRSDPSAATAELEQLISSIGLAVRLGEVGIRTAADRRLLVEQVNAERLVNNPRRLSAGHLGEIIETIA